MATPPLSRAASTSGRSRRPWRVLVASLVAASVACGGDGYDAPIEPAPADCPRIDDHLAPVYALLDAGKLTHLRAALSEAVPEDGRRDLVDTLLRLIADFEPGTFTAIAAWLDRAPDPGPGLSATLARILRWLVIESPAAPYPDGLRTLRSTLATCEGGPVLTLLADAVADEPLLRAARDALASGGLGDALADLDPDVDEGREATRLLLRNLLVAASGPDFDVATLLDLLGFLVDLDAAPWSDLAAGLERLVGPGPGLDALQALLGCLLAVDPAVSLGPLLFDLLTSDALDLPALIGSADEPPSDEPAIAPELARVAITALRFLAADPEARRALVTVGVELLRDGVAPGVLADVADLLDAGALGAVLEVLALVATRACAQ